MQPNKTRILVASLVLGGAQLALAADPPAQERDRTYAKVCGFCHDAGVGPAIPDDTPVGREFLCAWTGGEKHQVIVAGGKPLADHGQQIGEHRLVEPARLCRHHQRDGLARSFAQASRR